MTTVLLEWFRLISCALPPICFQILDCKKVSGPADAAKVAEVCNREFEVVKTAARQLVKDLMVNIGCDGNPV